MNNMISIGLPKGGLKKYSLNFISNLIGEPVESKKLSFSTENYTIFLLKHRDIPRFLECGLIDVGITSIEWVEESGIELNLVMMLNWCDTRISLIESKEKDRTGDSRSCVTEFPNIASKYFKEQGIECNIFHISGSSEACVPQIFDWCIDCVETGTTLLENDLMEKEIILESKVALFTKYEKVIPQNIMQRIMYALQRCGDE